MAGRETEADGRRTFSTVQGAMPESAVRGRRAASEQGSKGAEVEANAEKK